MVPPRGPRVPARNELATALEDRRAQNGPSAYLRLAFGATLLPLNAHAVWNEYAAQVHGYPAEFGGFFALSSYAQIVVGLPSIELHGRAALDMLFLWPLGQVPNAAGYPVWIFVTSALHLGMVPVLRRA